MKKAYEAHVTIIREAIAAIEAYRPADEEAFLASPVLQDAILMRLQVIGEHIASMRRLDEDHFAKMADISWYQLIGLRNVISHGYETIDQAQIWQMITSELPTLSETLDVLED